MRGYRLYHLVADHVVGNTELLFERADPGRLEPDPRHHVIAVVVPVYRIGQAALAPRLLVSDFTAEVGDNAVDALGGGGELLIAYRGPDNIHQFVVTHLSFTPPLYGLAPSPLVWRGVKSPGQFGAER
jgi:hypothetical protein